jgi:cellulose synthase/poly-beta-1,6-N-acetylglucosamine synthase-like glycosyltransferase
VLERTDPDHRGKGAAIEWALEQCGLDDCDVVLVTDADTQVESNALTVIAAAIERGAEVVQLNFEVLVGEESSLARLQHIANAVENRCFYNGRSLLGLPILLRGSGMAFTTDVLRAHPFCSHSITEDSDFAVDLMRDGIRVDYVMDSTISTVATSTYRQSQTQRDRWASGIFGLIKSRMIPLLRTGLAEARFDLIESAFSLLLLSRPTMIYFAALCMIFSLFCSPEHRLTFLIWADLLGVATIIYLAMGVFFVQDKWEAVKALFHAPVFGVWLLAVQVRALFGRKDQEWVRTEREGETKTPKS